MLFLPWVLHASSLRDRVYAWEDESLVMLRFQDILWKLILSAVRSVWNLHSSLGEYVKVVKSWMQTDTTPVKACTHTSRSPCRVGSSVLRDSLHLRSTLATSRRAFTIRFWSVAIAVTVAPLSCPRCWYSHPLQFGTLLRCNSNHIESLVDW